MILLFMTFGRADNDVDYPQGTNASFKRKPLLGTNIPYSRRQMKPDQGQLIPI